MKQLWRKTRWKYPYCNQYWYIDGFPYFNTQVAIYGNDGKTEELKLERVRDLRAACKRLVNIGEWDFKEYVTQYQHSYSYWTGLIQCTVYFPSRYKLHNTSPVICGTNIRIRGIPGNVTQAVKILKRHAHRFLKLTENEI